MNTLVVLLSFCNTTSFDTTLPSTHYLLLQSGVDYILFFRKLAEMSWLKSSGGSGSSSGNSASSSGGSDQLGDDDVARVMGELQDTFYDLSLHGRLVTALLTSNDKNSNNNQSNSNSSSDKQTTCVMEISDKQDEQSDTSSIPSLAAAWKVWFITYHTRLVTDNRPKDDRLKEMHETNPKYVLRSWMAILASEQVSN